MFLASVERRRAAGAAASWGSENLPEELRSPFNVAEGPLKKQCCRGSRLEGMGVRPRGCCAQGRCLPRAKGKHQCRKQYRALLHIKDDPEKTCQECGGICLSSSHLRVCTGRAFKAHWSGNHRGFNGLRGVHGCGCGFGADGITRSVSVWVFFHVCCSFSLPPPTLWFCC